VDVVDEVAPFQQINFIIPEAVLLLVLCSLCPTMSKVLLYDNGLIFGVWA
jgi:hypothetical protein